jgi:PAS domain S-box-containing protein
MKTITDYIFARGANFMSFMETFITSSEYGMLCVGYDGGFNEMLLSFNPAFQRMLKYPTADALRAKKLSEIIPEHYHEWLRQSLRPMLRGQYSTGYHERKYNTFGGGQVAVLQNLILLDRYFTPYIVVGIVVEKTVEHELKNKVCILQDDLQKIMELSPTTKMTASQVRVVRYVREGLTTKEIAVKLCLSEKTIDAHRGHIRVAFNIVGDLKSLYDLL